MIGDFLLYLGCVTNQKLQLREENSYIEQQWPVQLRREGTDTKEEESDIEAEKWKVWNTTDRCKFIDSATVNFTRFRSCEEEKRMMVVVHFQQNCGITKGHQETSIYRSFKEVKGATTLGRRI